MNIEGVNMRTSSKKAFTMIELVFVIVVIGILAAIAVPKLAATRDDAIITKAIATVGSVRSSISTERQKRILRGDFTNIGDLAFTNGVANPIFDFFDGNNTVGHEVLEYPLRACADGNARGCWVSTANTTYTYRMPASTNNVVFTLDSNNHFTCDTTDGTTGADCRMLTE